VLARPDARGLVPGVIASATGAVALVVGEHSRAGITVALAGHQLTAPARAGELWSS